MHLSASAGERGGDRLVPRFEQRHLVQAMIRSAWKNDRGRGGLDYQTPSSVALTARTR